MKKVYLIAMLLVAMPCVITSVDQSTKEDVLLRGIDQNIKKDIALQVLELQQMLIKSNDAYFDNISMCDQNLTLEWYSQCFIPLMFTRMFHAGHYYYNSEVLLAESKKLADIIIAMESIKELHDCDEQTCKLIKMLLRCNATYVNNTPMYDQDLTLQWYLQCFPPVCLHTLIQGGYYYNAEVLLTESKNIADVVTAMIIINKNKQSDL